MFAWDGGWQRIWVAAVLVRAQSQVCNVRGGRRRPANSLLLISEWRGPLSTATSLFIKIPDTHVSVSAHAYLCRRLRVSKSHIYMLCVLCLYDFVKLIEEGRPGQKQWGLTAKMPLKVHMKIPAKLKMTEKKNPPDNEERLVLHFILFTFWIAKCSCVDVMAVSLVGCII